MLKKSRSNPPGVIDKLFGKIMDNNKVRKQTIDSPKHKKKYSDNSEEISFPKNLAKNKKSRSSTCVSQDIIKDLKKSGSKVLEEIEKEKKYKDVVEELNNKFRDFKKEEIRKCENKIQVYDDKMTHIKRQMVNHMNQTYEKIKSTEEHENKKRLRRSWHCMYKIVNSESETSSFDSSLSFRSKISVESVY